MLMVSGPSEAKMFGKASSSTESSQSGYDMTGNHEEQHTHTFKCLIQRCKLFMVFTYSACTGTKHRGLKPGQRKELMAAAKEEARKTQQGIKKAVKE